MSNEPTVFVVDDEPAIRRSLRFMLEFHGYAVETYESADDFVRLATPDRCGCLLTDMRMPGMDGLELQDYLVANDVFLPVVIITGHGNVPLAVQAMKAGAVDFVEKPFDNETILDCIKRAYACDNSKEDHPSPSDGVNTAQARSLFLLLTEREREVFALLVDGATNKMIGLELGISPRTVENHRAQIMTKMRVRSVARLVRVGIEAGISTSNGMSESPNA